MKNAAKAMEISVTGLFAILFEEFRNNPFWCEVRETIDTIIDFLKLEDPDEELDWEDE